MGEYRALITGMRKLNRQLDGTLREIRSSSQEVMVGTDQIGKLAADSAQSAVTTKELIGKCLTEVEAGNSIVENTMKAINEVLASMESFAGMASGAADASKMQLDMLKEVGTGIDQITSVVQSNSAAAQETSAVSEELSAQATSLESMVERFKLRD